MKKYQRTPRGKFTKQKTNARRRGVAFDLTFDQWLSVWKTSGRFDARGNETADGYVMARNGDRGAYSIGNVRIIRHGDNIAERNRDYAHAKRSGVDWDWHTRQPIVAPEPAEFDDVPF